MAEDTNKQDGASINSELRPPQRMVNEFHTNDDLNRDQQAHHHTIGIGVNEAASGAHSHDGTNSVQLGKGVTVTGSRADGSALISLLQAMEQVLGITDSTTA